MTTTTQCGVIHSGTVFRAVCATFQVTMIELLHAGSPGAKTIRRIADARKAASYLLQRRSGWSPKEVNATFDKGYKWGGWSRRAAADLMTTDRHFRAMVERAERIAFGQEVAA